ESINLNATADSGYDTEEWKSIDIECIDPKNPATWKHLRFKSADDGLLFYKKYASHQGCRSQLRKKKYNEFGIEYVYYDLLVCSKFGRYQKSKTGTEDGKSNNPTKC
ncbi:hypothetical protein LINGRAHAP2_LOCUS23895, partial [Linum grandiflorum]